jgi:hypothetical protein
MTYPFFLFTKLHPTNRHCDAGSNLYNFSSYLALIGSLLNNKDCFLRRNDNLFDRSEVN